MLSYLFTDWVMYDEVVESLLFTKQMIENRKNKLTGHIPIIGFRTQSNVTGGIS